LGNTLADAVAHAIAVSDSGRAVIVRRHVAMIVDDAEYMLALPTTPAAVLTIL
jgi:hypothetical protein